MKTACLTALLFVFNAVHALDVREVVARMQEVYNKEAHLDYTCTYELFKGPGGTEAVTTYQGYVYRDRENVYQKIDQSEFIYSDAFFLEINHEEKEAVVSAPQRSVNLDVDMNAALKECSSLEMATEDKFYTITMHIKNTSSLPFSIVTMRIDKKKFFLEQLDIFYSSVQDFSEDPKVKDEAQPHLRVTFKTPKINPKTNNAYFTFETYLVTDNQSLVPTGIISGYSLTDNRQN